MENQLSLCARSADCSISLFYIFTRKHMHTHCETLELNIFAVRHCMYEGDRDSAGKRE